MTKADVHKELTEMKRVGMRVPNKAFELLEKEDLSKYDAMSVGKVADLLIDLSDL